MRSFNELYAIIALLGAVPGLFLAAFVWQKGGASRFLGAGLVAYCFLLGSMGFVRLGLMELSRQGNFFISILIHIAWPLFYLYVRALTRGEPEPKIDRRLLAHGGAFALYLFGGVLPVLVAPSLFHIIYIGAMALTGVVATGYSVAMLVELAQYKNKVASFFSEASRLHVTWITVNISLWLVVVVAQLLLFGIQQAGWQRPSVFEVIHGVLINILTASWVYVLGYYALARPRVLALSAQMNRELVPPLEQQPAPTGPDPMRTEDQKHDSRPSTEQEDSGASRSAEVLAKLCEAMEKQEPYLDEFLTLASLAKLCGVPAYLLGRVINKELGKNFMTYVNEHRVERAKELLRSPEHKEQRILDIAFSCGFRTKSAFNDSFKKLAGVTPSEFRQKEGNE